MPRGKKTQEEDEPPLVASEGVGSGGKGHIVSGMPQSGCRTPGAVSPG